MCFWFQCSLVAYTGSIPFVCLVGCMYLFLLSFLKPFLLSILRLFFFFVCLALYFNTIPFFFFIHWILIFFFSSFRKQFLLKTTADKGKTQTMINKLQFCKENLIELHCNVAPNKQFHVLSAIFHFIVQLTWFILAKQPNSMKKFKPHAVVTACNANITFSLLLITV